MKEGRNSTSPRGAASGPKGRGSRWEGQQHPHTGQRDQPRDSIWACSEAPPRPPRPSGYVSARRRRPAPGSQRDASCETRRTPEVRDLCEDGAVEGGKVQHRRQGKRAARVGAAAPRRAAFPLGSFGVHGVQGESWCRLRPLPPRVRTSLAHLSPEQCGVRGAEGVAEVAALLGTPPGRGCTRSRRCCPDAQPRTSPDARLPVAPRS